MQKKVKKEEKKSESSESTLSSQFDEIKNAAVRKMRTVKLRYHCSGEGFSCEVPDDSPLRDGDTVNDHQFPGDKRDGTYPGYNGNYFERRSDGSVRKLS